MPAYAVVDDYKTWAGSEADDLVDDALMRRAAAVVADLMVGVPYPIDSDGMPTKPAHRDAVRDATCAQAHWFAELGDASGVGAVMGGASIGSVQLPSRAKSDQSTQDARYAPEAVQALRRVGLLNRVVNG